MKIVRSFKMKRCRCRVAAGYEEDEEDDDDDEDEDDEGKVAVYGTIEFGELSKRVALRLASLAVIGDVKLTQELKDV